MSTRFLCIAGPTASGKSAAAMAIARVLPVEIVSVDSAQVYVGLDIGTAKPSMAERAAVPHHLIDLVPPEQPYSAARFVADATRCIDAIAARGRVPLLVGGTMLYFKALIDGIDALPEADPAVRADIDALAAAEGWPAVHAELKRVDPATAARLQPHDRQRLQRALEVHRLTGVPISAQRHGAAANRTPPPMLALEPRDRGWLHDRIAERFGAMLQAGLVDEVERLRRRPGVHAELPSMRAVGYRQVWQALDDGSLATPDGHRRLTERGIAATRQMAKRQLTWLRGLSSRVVVDCDAPDAVGRSVDWACTQARP